MASIQTQAALDLIEDLWGVQNWLAEPKEGVNIDLVLAQWDEELRRYTEEQIRTAVLKISKYRKTSVAPKLAHILAELVDVEPLAEDRLDQRARGVDDTAQRLTERYVRNGCRGRMCYAADVRQAFDLMFNALIAKLPREVTAGETYSGLLKLARTNGYLDRFENYLEKVTQNRRPYVPLEEEGRLYDVPAEFDPNNEKRKCA